MIKLDLTGLETMQRKLQQLHGTHQVPLAEMMNDQFISRHSRFASLNEMITASGLTIDCQADFQTDEWNLFVSQHSHFQTWHDMEQQAVKQWLQKQLS